MKGAAVSDVLQLDVGNVASGGGCVARAPDGRVVFVRHSLPGERVSARITATTSSFLRADAVEILRPSPDRVTPPCPHAGPGRCGGCDFQHVRLEAQRQLKAALVSEQLTRVAGVERTVQVEAVPGDDSGLGWRTRVRLAVGDDGQVGFRRHRSHDLELVDSCPIASPLVMDTGAFSGRWLGTEEIEVAVAPDTGDALTIAITDRRAKPQFPVIHGGLVVRGRVRKQPGSLCTTVSGSEFRISPGVFWQVHLGAPEVLADAVRVALGAKPGDHVVDLYAGAGLFAILLALDVGADGSVLAVERDRRACADAEHNARDLPQLRVKRASITPALIEKGIGRPDLLVLDPAREGAGRAIMTALAARSSTLRALVYVSCDASSFARDAGTLLMAGWDLASLRAFDIFPMTEHVELVAQFTPPSR